MNIHTAQTSTSDLNGPVELIPTPRLTQTIPSRRGTHESDRRYYFCLLQQRYRHCPRTLRLTFVHSGEFSIWTLTVWQGYGCTETGFVHTPTLVSSSYMFDIKTLSWCFNVPFLLLFSVIIDRRCHRFRQKVILVPIGSKKPMLPSSSSSLFYYILSDIFFIKFTILIITELVFKSLVNRFTDSIIIDNKQLPTQR